MKIDDSTIFGKKMGQDLSYNLYFEIFICFRRFLSESNKTGYPAQCLRNAKQF